MSTAIAINDEKIAYLCERHEGMVPDVGTIINTLTATSQKYSGRSRSAMFIHRDNGEPWTFLQRIKSLTAQWVTLHHVDMVRQGARLTAKNIDNAMTIIFNINPGKRMETLRIATINHAALGTIDLNDGSKGLKGIAGQGLDFQ